MACGMRSRLRVEADHGRLKARLRPMRGLKQERSPRVLVIVLAFVQNVRRATTNWPVTSRSAND